MRNHQLKLFHVFQDIISGFDANSVEK